MSALQKLLDGIVAPRPAAGIEAQRWLDQLTKPPGSLGRLEELARRLAEISGTCPPSVRHPVIFTLAGDHGVVEAGVSAYPQIVTAQMVENFLRGGAAVNVLARHVGARVVVADLGVASPLPDHVLLKKHRIGPGTANMTRGPAMSGADAVAAIEAGIALVDHERALGIDVIATGEMGIGNTTAASAMAAAFTGAPPESVPPFEVGPSASPIAPVKPCTTCSAASSAVTCTGGVIAAPASVACGCRVKPRCVGGGGGGGSVGVMSNAALVSGVRAGVSVVASRALSV